MEAEVSWIKQNLKMKRNVSEDRKATKQLTYPELGNPLFTVVQSLFQCLSKALTDSPVQFRYSEPCKVKTV